MFEKIEFLHWEADSFLHKSSVAKFTEKYLSAEENLSWSQSLPWTVVAPLIIIGLICQKINCQIQAEVGGESMNLRADLWISRWEQRGWRRNYLQLVTPGRLWPLSMVFLSSCASSESLWIHERAELSWASSLSWVRVIRQCTSTANVIVFPLTPVLTILIPRKIRFLKVQV